MVTTSPYFPTAILVFILFHSTHFTTAQSETKGFSLKLIPIFSPESPLFPKNLTQPERLQKLIEISIARAKNLQSQYTKLEPENIHLPINEYRGIYYVEVSIGTPGRAQLLVMDTGSDLTWTQCRPSKAHFNQSTPIFDTGSSSSYRALPCDHPLCRSRYPCVDGKCVYRRKYVDLGVSNGVLSSETFRFPSNNGIIRAFPGIIFGCSDESSGFNFGGKLSGIFGLNSDLDSLVTQLNNNILGRFSYCLVSDHQMPGASILRFGEDAMMRSAAKSTPILRPNNVPSNYYLDLIDISVGSTRLQFPPGTFAVRNRRGGCVIDSGSTFSHFQRAPYDAIMKAFDQHFTSFRMQRIHVRGQQMEYCYTKSPNFRAYAAMTYHFRGADFVVEPANLYLQYPQYFCVALLPIDGPNILGAMQQQYTRVLYDIRMGVLKFAAANCALDTL